MTRFHVVFKEHVSTFGEMTVSGIDIEEGFKGIFDFDADDFEFIEECLEADENVISYDIEAR